VAKAWIEIAPGRYRLVDTGATAVASRVDAPFVRNEHISPEERRKLALQLGERFDSESALRRYMKDNGLRLREKGDRMDKIRTARKAWLADTKPGQRGKNPIAGPRGYSHG
jgi:hypothetical protein